MDTTPLKAAILLIGDELLTGKVRESNGHFLIRSLRDLGAQVTELHMVADHVPRIAEALLLVRDRNDVVFSCGGVGPTHDDRTLEAVAAAWGVPLEVNPQMAALLQSAYGEGAARWMKIAHMPRGSELIFHTPGGWPCCRMGNVFIFPGSPPYVEAHFGGLKPRFTRPTPIFLAALDLHLDEGALAPLLADAEARFPPIQIGSYPVTLEARQRPLVLTATAWLREQLNPLAIYAAQLPE